MQNHSVEMSSIHVGSVTSVQWTNITGTTGEQYLLTGGADGVVNIFDARMMWKPLVKCENAECTEPVTDIQCLYPSSLGDSYYVVSSNTSGMVSIWDPLNGDSVGMFMTNQTVDRIDVVTGSKIVTSMFNPSCL